MKMTHLQYAPEPALNPGFPLHGPTLWTASAPAAVVADAREPTVTRVLMATQRCSPAAKDGVYGLVLVLVQRMAEPEAVERVRQDVLHLKVFS